MIATSPSCGGPRALRVSDRIWRRIHGALVWLVLIPVWIYRRVLSPLKPAPTCRFAPTCSQYALDAVRERGIVVGVGLAIWRIARCNPWCEGGHDPVPHERNAPESPHAGSR